MTDKPQALLRPLKAEDIETVAAFERDIAAISFPDDPITDLAFYKKKVGKLIDDRNAATFVADDGTGPVGWAYVSKRQNFITKESYADFHSIFSARRSAAPARPTSWPKPCSISAAGKSSTAWCSAPAPTNRR